MLAVRKQQHKKYKFSTQHQCTSNGLHAVREWQLHDKMQRLRVWHIILFISGLILATAAPADTMKRWRSIEDIEPMQQRKAWHPHYKRWLNTTFLYNQHRKRRRQKVTHNKKAIRYRAPIWDKYLLIVDMLQQTSSPTMSVSVYRYLCRNEENNFRRHAHMAQYRTLVNWKTKYSKPEALHKLRKCWLDVVSRQDTNTKNVYNPKREELKLGRAPILEEFLHWKHKWRGNFSMDRSYRWFKTEMRRLVKSPVHFTILEHLFDPKGDEGKMWRTHKFSWGYMQRVKVCVHVVICDFNTLS